jgi:hypothetical protein
MVCNQRTAPDTSVILSSGINFLVRFTREEGGEPAKNR